MKRESTIRKHSQAQQAGAAMLIAIFALMLVSVVAIALVISSGTDSALAGNYRTSSSAYYAALAGLEEARGRLLWKNADFLNKTGSYTNVLFDASGAQPAWCINKVLYITNPAPGETVDPAGGNPANYQDTEYVQEFPAGLGSATVLPYVPSVSGGVNVPSGTLPGPSYKWVRINAVNEPSLKIDVNGDGNTNDPGTLFYDPAHLNALNQASPSLVVPPLLSCPPGPPPVTAPATVSTAVQALEITSLAVAPNGGQRLLQYVVAPLVISPDAGDQNFPAAVTLDDGLTGGAVSFNVPTGYQINGVNNCAAAPQYPGSVSAIGYSSSADTGYITTQASLNPSDYPGAVLAPPAYQPAQPSTANLGLPLPNTILRQSWLQPATLDAAMQDIVNSADVVIQGPATDATILAAAPTMSATNPMTVVVKGDLTLAGAFGAAPTGYGLLLVTGTLTFHPSAAWDGIVLVVGRGQFLLAGHHGTGGIVGTVFVAQTKDAAGNLLPNLQATFGPSTGSATGNGIAYNSCWVKTAQGPLSYKVLSFREIPTP
jgi:hypothetical protein